MRVQRPESLLSSNRQSTSPAPAQSADADQPQGEFLFLVPCHAVLLLGYQKERNVYGSPAVATLVIIRPSIPFLDRINDAAPRWTLGPALASNTLAVWYRLATECTCEPLCPPWCKLFLLHLDHLHRAVGHDFRHLPLGFFEEEEDDEKYQGRDDTDDEEELVIINQ